MQIRTAISEKPSLFNVIISMHGTLTTNDVYGYVFNVNDYDKNDQIIIAFAFIPNMQTSHRRYRNKLLYTKSLKVCMITR